MLPKALILTSLVALAACSTTGCDPSRASLLESMQCENGGFQNRQSFLQQNLNAAQANAEAQRQAANRAGSDAAEAQRSLAERRAELARLDRNIAELRRQIQLKMANRNVNQAAAQQTANEINMLQHQQDLIQKDPGDSDLRAIDERQKKILKALQAL